MNKLLIVEDMADMRDFMRHMLARHGFSVETAADGVEGLEAVSRLKPDLVLLNVLMPRMDGLTMLGRLRASPSASETPVIMITASKRLAIMEEAGALGVLDYFPCPFDFAPLLEAISGALDPGEGGRRWRSEAGFRLKTRMVAYGGGSLAEALAGLPLKRLSPEERRQLREALRVRAHRGVEPAAIAAALLAELL